MNRQTRPEATTHGGKRRLRLRIGHSSKLVSGVALAFCLALLSISLLSVLATSQRADAHAGARIFPTLTPTDTPTPILPTPTPTATTAPPTPTPTATTPPPTPTPTATTPPPTPTPTATTPPPTPTPIPGVTPTATKIVPTATPKAGGVGGPPPGGIPTQNPGPGKPTPPTKGGTPPNNNYPTATPAGGNDQGNGGGTQTNVNMNGNTGTTGTTTDSTGLIVGASAGVVLLLILAGIGGWLLYNKRMDEQAKSGISPASGPPLPEQGGWNSLQANAGLAGMPSGGAPGAPTMMQQPISFGMNDGIPTTPPPDYNAMHQSMENAGYHNEGMAAHAGEAGYQAYHNEGLTAHAGEAGSHAYHNEGIAAHAGEAHYQGYHNEGLPNGSGEAGYQGFHSEYATVQSHSPLDEQALLGYGNGAFGQVPETPLPTSPTESYLDEVMQQAQVGLFVLPDKEA